MKHKSINVQRHVTWLSDIAETAAAGEPTGVGSTTFLGRFALTVVCRLHWAKER